MEQFSTLGQKRTLVSLLSENIPRDQSRQGYDWPDPLSYLNGDASLPIWGSAPKRRTLSKAENVGYTRA
jgi:hypothetical protein